MQSFQVKKIKKSLHTCKRAPSSAQMCIFPQHTSSCGKGGAASCFDTVLVLPVTTLLCQRTNNNNNKNTATRFAPATGFGCACLRRAGSQHHRLLRARTQQQARGGLRHSTCFAMFVSLQGWDPSPATAPYVTQHPPTCCPICHCPWACWSSSSTRAELCPASHVPQQHCACRRSYTTDPWGHVAQPLIPLSFQPPSAGAQML